MQKNAIKINVLFFVIFLAVSVLFVFTTLPNDMQNGALDLSDLNQKGIVAFTEKMGVPEEDTNGTVKATYTIHVTGAQTGQTLAIRVPLVSTSYSLYIDDILMVASGKITSATVSLNEATSFAFTPQSQSFDIVIVSAAEVFPIGNNLPISYLGTPSQISRLDHFLLGYDSFIIGLFFIIILFNLFYFFLRKDKSFLVLISICLMVMIRSTIYGSNLLFGLFPDIDIKALFYLDNITFFLLPSAWVMVPYVCIPELIPKKIFKPILCFSVAAALLSLAAPATNAWLIDISGVILILTSLCLIWKVLNAIIKKQGKLPVDMILILGGVTILAFCSIVDVLYITIFGQPVIGYIPTGLIFLLLSWEYYYTYQYDMLMKDRLKVLEELNKATENERELELKYLKSQIRPHFIHNALSTIISTSRTDNERSKYLLYEFSNYLRSCYDIGKLEDVMPIESELSFIHAYVALEEARFQDNLRVSYDIADDLQIAIPPLILQPLVENAIVHNKISAKHPLSVKIYVIPQDNTVKIGVKDNGEGLDQEKVRSTLNGEQIGHGVGLNNINQRLIKIYGTTLQFESPKNGGAEVYMVITDNGRLLNDAGCDY